MHIRWIGDLLALADAKSFSRAAELRHITQSALSRRIRSLEEWVGADLVDRGTYPMELTPAGRLFCEQGREALRLLVEARADIRQETRMPGKAIQVCAGHTLSMTFLPKWMKQFQLRHGHFNARVVAENVLDAVTALSEGSCDLMFCYHHPRAPILLDPDKFDYLVLGHEAFVPVTALASTGKPAYTLPGRKNIPIPYLAYTSTTFLGRVVDAILKQAPDEPFLERCYEADMAMLLMNMAKEGYGVAWLPESAVAEALQQGILVHAGGEAWSTRLEIRLYRATHSGNTTLQDLWQALSQDSQLPG
jgi:DNA-binding transcriptional LysR family regulator